MDQIVENSAAPTVGVLTKHATEQMVLGTLNVWKDIKNQHTNKTLTITVRKIFHFRIKTPFKTFNYEL